MVVTGHSPFLVRVWESNTVGYDERSSKLEDAELAIYVRKYAVVATRKPATGNAYVMDVADLGGQLRLWTSKRGKLKLTNQLQVLQSRLRIL